MTNPVDLVEIVPTKAKAWVALFGSFLTFMGPYILAVTDTLSAPWPLVVGLFFAAATWLGVYKVRNTPEGTVVVDAKVVEPELPPATYENPARPSPDSGFKNPWR